MKSFILIVALAALSICSCSDKGPRLPIGDDPSWISSDAARKLCEGFLQRQGYTSATVVGQTVMREKCWYAFETNGAVAPLKVEVDRKSRKVGYGDWKH